MTSLLPREASRSVDTSTGMLGASAAPAAPARAYSKVHRQDQPHGEDGIRFSLKKVCLMIAEGRLNPDVRSWTTKMLARAGNPKGPKARAAALLEALRTQSGWVPDPTDAEFMAGAHLTLGDGDKPPYFALGDCFPQGTLTLTDKHELRPIEALQPGDRIWGLDRWSTVEQVAFKGLLQVDVLHLNNGSDLPLTADHHVYVLDCREHPMLDEADEPAALPADRTWRGGGSPDNQRGCTCSNDLRVEKRTRVSEVREGMVLPAPERVPFGSGTRDPDLAWIDGLYVADGWCEPHRFAISGKDGHPKEAQKRAVKDICDRLGVDTTWSDRYLRVNDPAWTLRMQQMGTHAPDKRLLSIDLDEGTAGATLRGVMADSGKNTSSDQRTFTTTSRLLAVQTRVLHRMFGVTCGWRHVTDHGGLGKNPVYRLGTRGKTRLDGRAPWLLRVKRIDRQMFEAPCWDITTDDHRVYLPEHDVTVSQCDDLTIALGSAILTSMMYLAAAESVGTKAAVVGHAYGKDRMIEHVLGAIYDPNDNRWYYVDPSLKTMPFGECRPFTRERVYLVPSAELFCDDTVCLRPGGRAAVAPPAPKRGDFVSVNGTPGADSEVYEVVPATWDHEPAMLAGPSGRRTLIDDTYTDVTGINEATVTWRPRPTQTEVENQATLAYWMDLEPCGDNPLTWQMPFVPPAGDYAAQDLFTPWSDAPDRGSGASMIVRGSAFLPGCEEP